MSPRSLHLMISRNPHENRTLVACIAILKLESSVSSPPLQREEGPRENLEELQERIKGLLWMRYGWNLFSLSIGTTTIFQLSSVVKAALILKKHEKRAVVVRVLPVYAELVHFTLPHVAALWRAAKKCTKIDNTRATCILKVPGRLTVSSIRKRTYLFNYWHAK